MRVKRLKKKKEISHVFKAGKRFHAASLTVVCLASQTTRAAVCVGKKYGKSVQRNRIKRLLREAFRAYGDRLRPCHLLLVPKLAEEYRYAQFKRDLGKIFKREGLLED